MIRLTSALGTKAATFSDDRAHRVSLERTWDRAIPPLGFVCLNPSVADQDSDDPTIRRQVGFAKREGAGGLIACNLSPFRATDPDVLYRMVGKLGTVDDSARAFPSWHGELVIEALRPCSTVIAGWGNFAGASRPARAVLCLFARELTRTLASAEIQLQCLGMTADGHPRHPLYLAADAPLRRWTVPL